MNKLASYYVTNLVIQCINIHSKTSNLWLPNLYFITQHKHTLDMKIIVIKLHVFNNSKNFLPLSSVKKHMPYSDYS
jgi:hypothetical protein